jgi:GntR family transcriptional regulator
VLRGRMAGRLFHSRLLCQRRCPPLEMPENSVVPVPTGCRRLLSNRIKVTGGTPGVHPAYEVSQLRQVGYREIAKQLTSDIRQGVWKAGAEFPTEAELVGRFRASRNTVRESLRELEGLGYVKRRRGARSILISADPPSEFTNSVQSIGEWLQYSRSTVSNVLTTQIVVANSDLSQHLGVPVESKWLKVEVMGANQGSSQPIGFSEMYIDERYADIADELQSNNGVAYTILERMHGVIFRQVSQKIQAAAANANIASRLNIPIGSPILSIRTDFITNTDQLVEIGFWHFPAGKYHFEMTLKRGKENRVRARKSMQDR